MKIIISKLHASRRKNKFILPEKSSPNKDYYYIHSTNRPSSKRRSDSFLRGEPACCPPRPGRAHSPWGQTAQCSPQLLLPLSLGSTWEGREELSFLLHCYVAEDVGFQSKQRSLS